METDLNKVDIAGGAEELERDERQPYTRPRIESAEAFESFTLTSCGLVPDGCIDATNP